MSSERWLRVLLRALGAFDLLALAGVIMPQRWMADIHAWLGMGEMPEAPVVEYLARSASLMYAMHAVFVLFVSGDVRRYRPLITLMAVVAMISGCTLLAIDVGAGVPWFWTVVEGPDYIVVAVAVLWLQGRSQKCESG